VQGKSDTPKKATLCAIYTRVSTDMQAEIEFNSCEAQEDRVRSFINSQEGFKVFRVYTDPGFSGANLDRPAMKEMLRDIAEGSVHMVITYKIDRLTRSPRDFYQLIEYFEKYNAGFISVTERFDTSTPSGRLLRNIMLTFAQFERELASERVKDKIVQRAQRGLFIGGPCPFGYRLQDKRLVPDPPKDKMVATIFNTYVETRSIARILDMLREKGFRSRNGTELSDTFVWHLLRMPIYTGTITHKGKTYPGQHQPLVSKELFDHVQRLIAEQPRRAPEPVPNSPFSGLIHCQECGSVMTTSYTDKTGKRGPRRYHYYRCSNLSHKGWANCSIREISAERFENMLYSNLLRISRDKEYLKNLVFFHKNQTPKATSEGIEPDPQKDGLTPENLKKALEEFLTICARRTGMERILAIRQRIAGISYSKETVGVNFIFARPPDGKSKSEDSHTTAAPSAAPPFCPPAQKQKRPGRNLRPDPFLEFVSHEMVGTLCPLQKTVMFSFPNIAHNYWDHYRLTGEFYVRPAKAPRL
jgi:site-specific DNA recombinase